MKSFSFLFIVFLLSLFSLLSAHSGDTLFVPFGTKPVIDGQISAGEWDDADSVVTPPLPEGPAVIYYKQNPDSLYIAINMTDGTYNDFDNASIYFDVDHDGGGAPQIDDFGCGSHRGGMIVEFVGTGSGWAMDTIDGWFAQVYSASGYWQVEFSVSFGRLGISPGVAKTIGFDTRLGDNGNGSANWPVGASNSNPDTWADIASPDNWASPDSIPPSVFVVQPNGGEIIDVGAIYPVMWYASDSGGVDSVSIYYSADAGGSWNVVSTGEPNDSVYLWTIPNTPSDSCLVRVIAYDPSSNSAQDESDSLFTISAVGIHDDIRQSEYEKINLFHFPEPFATNVIFSFLLLESSNIDFSIYDISGRLVKTIYGGSMGQGQHSFIWNGTDSRNRKVSQGVYFAKAIISGETLIRRITLIR